MKVNRKLIAVMALMAAGAAAAEGTLANTTISNTANATYDVPGTNPGDPATPGSATSNTVTTTVLPKPDFDIVFKGNTPTDGGTQADLTTTTKVITAATPGSSYTTPYTILNNGNVALKVDVAADTTGATTGQTVAYYLDVNKDGVYQAGTDTALTDTNSNGIVDYIVPADDLSTGTDEGVVEILQVVTIPAAATPTNVFGASPEGSVTGTGTTATSNGYTSGSTNNYEEAKAVNTDLQFVKITMFTPSLNNNPNPTTTPTNPTKPDGTAYTPPAVGTVSVPTLTPGTTDTTPNTPPVNTPVPGYTDAGSTPIVPDLTNDNQFAYPKADADTNADKVTFTNSLVNTGTASDTVQLYPALADGTPDTGYTFNSANGTFTNATTGVVVRFLDPVTGNPIPVAPGATYPSLVVPAGATAYYLTEVTYPDPDDSSNIEPIVVPIGADSINDSGIKSDAGVTTDTIYPPAAQFGDSTSAALGTVSTPAPVQTVTPNGTFDTTPKDSPNVTDSTATFPMDLANLGEYADTFKLTGSVTFGTVTVPVKYYDANGTLLPTDSSGNYISPVVGPDSEIVVYAVVDVPAGTATGDYTVSQSATGYYSTIPMADNNDVIRVAPLGAVALAKFTKDTSDTLSTTPAANSMYVNGTVCTAGAPSATQIGNPVDYTCNNTQYKPGDTVNYQIIAKNNYNTAVAKFAICDGVPTNTTFSSVALSPAPSRVIYNVNNAGWSTTAPAAGLAEGTTVCVAPDTNSDNVPDALASGATLTANFAVVVK